MKITDYFHAFQEAFFGSDLLVKSREAPKESMKALEQEEEKVAAESVKLFVDSTVHDESSIQISSQIQKQLKEMPKPSTAPTDIVPSSANQEPSDLLPTDTSVSPEPTDFQLPEDVDNFDIDESFIKMIEDELGGKSLDDDIESGIETKRKNLCLLNDPFS